MPQSKHSHTAFPMPDRILKIERFSLFDGLNPSDCFGGHLSYDKGSSCQPATVEFCVAPVAVRKVSGLVRFKVSTAIRRDNCCRHCCLARVAFGLPLVLCPSFSRTEVNRECSGST
jgi:hypothetical protein